VEQTTPFLKLRPKSLLAILRHRAPRFLDPVLASINDSLALLEDGPEVRELVARLAGKHHNDVWSADAELFFAAYSRRRGFAISLHPQQKNNKRPEFRATKDSVSFLLEVRSLVPPGTDTIEGDLRSYLEEHCESVFGTAAVHVEVEPQGKVSGSMPKRHLLAALKRCYQRYSEGIGDEYREVVDSIPFKIKFVDFGGGGPSLGWSKGAGAIDEVERIRDAIEEKTYRYGELNEPFVVVVDSQDWFRVSPEQLNWALLGKLVTYFNVPKIGSPDPISASQTTRTRDGVFRADKNTRLSAVIYHRAAWNNSIWEHTQE
jgi:hypothetical protein